MKTFWAFKGLIFKFLYISRSTFIICIMNNNINLNNILKILIWLVIQKGSFYINGSTLHLKPFTVLNMIVKRHFWVHIFATGRTRMLEGAREVDILNMVSHMGLRFVFVIVTVCAEGEGSIFPDVGIKFLKCAHIRVQI